jgi:hypothetical protein
MPQSTQISTVPRATARVAERPPILEATRALGVNDSMLARALGISKMTVADWGLGKRPIPIVRHLALLFLVTRLTGLVGAKYPPQSRYARRAAIARDAAIAWANLARDELDEDTAGIYRAEDLERGVALGESPWSAATT